MARYAERECADCHIILPAPEMIARSGRSVAGQSETVTRPSGSFENQYPRPTHSTTTHYENYKYYLCSRCHEQRKAATRRLIAVLAIVAVVAVGLLLTFAAVSDVGRSRVAPIEEQLEPEQRTIVSEDEAAVELTRPSTEAAATHDEGDILSEKADELSTSSENFANADPPPVPSANELSFAVEDALNTGTAVSWRSGDQSGQVLVSSAAVISDGECRTVSVQGQSATWCKRGSSGWQLVR